LPQGIDLWGGSSWNFMQFITECLAAHDGDFSAHQHDNECGLVTHLLDYGQYKISFEELYFQTLARMSSFCEHVANHDLRYINWKKDDVKKGAEKRCMHWEEVDWCGNSPQWLTGGDYTTAIRKHPAPPPAKAEPRFFSRKYRDPAALDAADKQLGIDSMHGMPAALNESMHKDGLALMTGGLADPKHNVALLKPVTVTSVQHDDGGEGGGTHTFRAQHLVDGSLHTRWSSRWSDDQQKTELLASPYCTHKSCNVSEVRLHWESAFATEYVLLVQQAGSEDWHECVRVNKSSAKIGLQLIHSHLMNQTAVDTSRVGALRLTMVKRATRWGYSLWEMEVLGEC